MGFPGREIKTECLLVACFSGMQIRPRPSSGLAPGVVGNLGAQLSAQGPVN